jgi:hypothetical protein
MKTNPPNSQLRTAAANGLPDLKITFKFPTARNSKDKTLSIKTGKLEEKALMEPMLEYAVRETQLIRTSI